MNDTHTRLPKEPTATKVRADGTFEWWGWYWILLFAGTAFGLIDIALRRAIRLQHETEGLV